MTTEQQLQELRVATMKYMNAEARLAEESLLNSRYHERDIALAELVRVLEETEQRESGGVPKFALDDRVHVKGKYDPAATTSMLRTFIVRAVVGEGTPNPWYYVAANDMDRSAVMYFESEMLAEGEIA